MAQDYNQKKRKILLAFFIIIAITSIAYMVFSRPLIRAVYEGHAPGFLNNIIKGRYAHPLEAYIIEADIIFILLNLFICLIALLLMTAKSRYIHILAVLGSAGALLIYLGTARFGIGATADTVRYLSAARSLVSGKGFLDFNGSPFSLWPPLFPFILAILELLKVDALDGIRIANAIFFGSTIFLSGILLSKSISSKKLVLLGSASILLSGPLLRAFSSAMSEPLFILLTVLFFILLYDFIGKKHVSTLCGLSIITSLACLLKYTGVIIYLVGLIFILLSTDDTLTKRLKYAAIFSAITIAPLGIWILRNAALTSTLVGYRSPIGCPLPETIFAMLNIFSSWFIPFYLPESLRISSIVLIAGITPILLSMRSQFENNRSNNSVLLLAPISFVLIYSITIIISTGSLISKVHERLLSPLYILFVLIFCSAIDRLLTHEERAGNKILNEYLTLGICAAWLAYPFLNTVMIAAKWEKAGVGPYNTARWHDSLLVKWLEDHPLRGRIYSNAPQHLYVLTKLRSESPPYKNGNTTEAINISPGLEDCYLIWFENVRHGDIPDIRELQSRLNLSEIAKLADGKVYRIKR